MAQPTVECPSYETNLILCPCLSEDCPNRGICCECMRNHLASTQWPLTACMRGASRPESTMSLSKAVPADCPNRVVNLEGCACTSDSCERRGACCVCVRHHWLPEGSNGTACMRPRM
jgi:hypothetical protein